MSAIINPSSCLLNVIALDASCSPVAPTSGIYASKAGITRSYLTEIITKDYASVEALFKDKLSLAIDIITNQIHAIFQPRYRAKSVVDGFKMGFPVENKVIVPSVATYKGILFDMSSESSYVDFFISELSLFVNYTGTVQVNVFDLIQGSVIDTITVDAVAGKITTIYPQKLYRSSKRKLQLYFAYDASSINSFKTQSSSNGCTSCSGHMISNSYETMGAFAMELSASAVRSSMIPASDTGGLSITHSLQCNHTEWICANSNLLSNTILFKTASLLHEFALNESPNTRFNTTEGLNADLIDRRMKNAEMQYLAWMDNHAGSMVLPNDQLCYQCFSNYNHKISLP